MSSSTPCSARALPVAASARDACGERVEQGVGAGRGCERPLHDPRRSGGAERPEDVAIRGFADPRQREPGPPKPGQPEVHGAGPTATRAVEAWLSGSDEAVGAHRGLERARAHPVLDPRGLAQQLRHRRPFVAGEVRAHLRAQVGCLADVDDVTDSVPERVHTRFSWERTGERELRRRPVHPDLRQREEVVEPEHAERARVFEQRVEHLTRRGRVGVGAVHRLGVGAEVGGERVQAQVRHVLAHEAAREPDGVDPAVREPRVTVAAQRGVEEGAVEADVVPDDHRAARGTRAASAAALRSPAPAPPSLR